MRHRRPALINNPNASENQNHGEALFPIQMVKADDDADDGGDDGLNVVVHADQGGAQPFLPDGNQEIGDEGGKNHHVGHLPQHLAFHLGKGQGEEMPRIEGQGHHHRKQEHPLHEGDHVIFRDQGAEDAKIHGKGEAVGHGEHNAHRLGFGSPAAQTHRIEYQEQNARKTHQHTTNFLESDRLLQDDGGHKHGHDRRTGVGDAQVDGGRHGDGLQEAHLGQEEAEHGRHKDLQQVFQRHFFLGHEKRQQPKQEGGSRRPQAKQVHGRQHVGVGNVLATNDVEPKDAVGTKTREVSDEDRRLIQSNRHSSPCAAWLRDIRRSRSRGCSCQCRRICPHRCPIL